MAVRWTIRGNDSGDDSRGGESAILAESRRIAGASLEEHRPLESRFSALDSLSLSSDKPS
ncbi:hypothetical protein BD309DRAFT_967122 [Dichomitus squalens]|nr:hypothetical protein BD309DRAFT_967122 [Dichomitus squalens]